MSPPTGRAPSEARALTTFNVSVDAPRPLNALEPGDVFTISIRLSDRVGVFNGVGLNATNSNDADPGLDGVAGSAQFRLSFQVVGFSTTTIRIGTGYNGDAEVLAGGETNQSADVQISITSVPEPGTALLVGLGLVALASRSGRGLEV